MSTATPSANRSLLILFSVIVLDLIGFGVVVPILPFYAKQYGASATVLGLLLTSYSAMQFAFSSLWGRLSDRIGRKKTLVLTIAGSAASLVLVGLANSLLLLFAGRILSGIFAANISVASAYVTDVTTEENRSKGMGMIGAAFGIGFLLGPALGGVLSHHGYHVPILTAAALSALNFLYALWRLPEPARHHKPSLSQDEVVETRVLAQPQVFKLCAIYFLFTIAVNQLESIFAFFMMRRFSYDAMHVAYILALMALIMIVIQGGLIRTLTQRYGETLLLLSGSLLLGASFACVPLSPTVALLLLPLGIASVGRGISQPSLLSIVSKKSSPQMRGAVMGTFQASASLGRVIGPVIAGFLFDQGMAFPFYLAGGLMAAVFLLSLNT
ncbi:MAG TPA: MFS transporter [bacterium]|nr:MFS transporter [bacterium]